MDKLMEYGNVYSAIGLNINKSKYEKLNKMVGTTSDVLKHKSLIHVSIHGNGVYGTLNSISYLEYLG
jgi:hypothetical protein